MQEKKKKKTLCNSPLSRPSLFGTRSPYRDGKVTKILPHHVAFRHRVFIEKKAVPKGHTRFLVRLGKRPNGLDSGPGFPGFINASSRLGSHRLIRHGEQIGFLNFLGAFLFVACCLEYWVSGVG